MSIGRFLPVMALATGGFAAPAGAVVVTQNFGVTSGDITIGGSGAAQYRLAYNAADPENQNAALLTVKSLDSAQLSGPSTVYSFPDADTGLASTIVGVKAVDPAADQFLQLKFDINGKSTFGVATITPDLSLQKVDYLSVVPEPAVWGQMILGLGLAGTALRTSRRRRPALAA